LAGIGWYNSGGYSSHYSEGRKILFPIRRNEMNNNNSEPHTETIAETDNFLAWKAEEPDGETTYHVELNNVTVHFFEEEWTEFLQLVRSLK
jgi:hypothetical protein